MSVKRVLFISVGSVAIISAIIGLKQYQEPVGVGMIPLRLAANP
jgi:hypothetical protein